MFLFMLSFGVGQLSVLRMLALALARFRLTQAARHRGVLIASRNVHQHIATEGTEISGLDNDRPAARSSGMYRRRLSQW